MLEQDNVKGDLRWNGGVNRERDESFGFSFISEDQFID